MVGTKEGQAGFLHIVLQTVAHGTAREKINTACYIVRQDGISAGTRSLATGGEPGGSCRQSLQNSLHNGHERRVKWFEMEGGEQAAQKREWNAWRRHCQDGGGGGGGGMGGGTRLFVDPHVHCGRLLAPVLPSSKHPPSPLSLSPLNYYVHADLQVRKRGYESMNVS